MQLLVVNPITINRTINSVDIHMKLFAKPDQSEQNPERLKYCYDYLWNTVRDLTDILDQKLRSLCNYCYLHRLERLIGTSPEPLLGMLT